MNKQVWHGLLLGSAGLVLIMAGWVARGFYDARVEQVEDSEEFADIQDGEQALWSGKTCVVVTAGQTAEASAKGLTVRPTTKEEELTVNEEAPVVNNAEEPAVKADEPAVDRSAAKETDE